MLIKIDEKVYEKLPDVEIGYLLAQVPYYKNRSFCRGTKNLFIEAFKRSKH